MSERLVIFGGSFNPPHRAHRELLDKVNTVIKARKIIIVPCCIQPLKGPCDISALHRLEMLKIMFTGTEYMVSDYEVKKGGTSFSIDTVEYFSRNFKGRIYFVMGYDSFVTINKWKDHERLLELTNLVVFGRGSGCEAVKIPGRTRKISDDLYVNSQAGKLIYYFSGYNNSISSTDIRKNFSLDQKRVYEYLEKEVFDYIRKNKLYSGSRDAI
ncbi:MAG: nicotinate (nicotinamide) nucleotide adenylyltransferase [Oligoflexia bacterium]|nr:nicotinate (nicotinamide) nucleotide adenylyltransferase [Oligoflexia bacterium]